ncbi:MAG: FAD synthetase family protein [Chlamydiales bacterium]|nr:FAD synthetase family protein [Chlamydiales bacterium]
MLTVTTIDDIPQKLDTPIAVTLGSYDGIHLGHQSIFKRLKQLGKTSVVVTFSNHPSEVLTPGHIVQLIYPPETKLKLIEALGIDLTVLLPFTLETASNTYDQFLLKLRQKLPFDYLILGEDARLGKGRTGTPDAIRALAQNQGFSVEYLPKLEKDGGPVSSGRIRKLLSAGAITEASHLLGRPYP